MPNRIIRDSARTSPTLDVLTDGAERCFWRLTTTADDYGRFLADPRTVMAACFPLKVGLLPVKRVATWLDEMGRVGLVCFYRIGDRVYGEFTSSEKHFDKRARTSKYPPPSSANICGHVLADVCMPTQMSAELGDDIDRIVPSRADNTPLRTDARNAQASASTRQQMLASTEGFESSEAFDSDSKTKTTATAMSPRAEEATADSWSRAKWPSPEALAHLYNTSAPDNLPAVETLSDKRKQGARTVLRQFPAREWWVDVFAEYTASRFLSGKSPPSNGHPNFKPDFDWLLRTGKKGTENAVRVHDGVYR